MIEIETTGLGFNHCIWPAASREEAEELARRMSISEADNPSYPNPYFVLEGGRPVAKYYHGERVAA